MRSNNQETNPKIQIKKNDQIPNLKQFIVFEFTKKTSFLFGI